MGLFGKNKEEKRSIPELPPLPKLPDFPEIEDDQIHGLPSFPTNNLGMKFSQNTIKEAVSGEKEDSKDDEEDFMGYSDERMMPGLLKKPMTEEFDNKRLPTGFSGSISQMSSGPVFIQIDKFEAAMEVFKKTKKKIAEIEATLEEIKKVKEKEDEELRLWESEVKTMKDQIEKVDRDVFSKI